MKKTEIVAMEKLRDEIEHHPYTIRIRKEHEEQIIQTRKKSAAQIEALKAEALRMLPELQAEEDRAREAIAEHDEQRKVLLENMATAAKVKAEERLRIERETAAAEEVLLSNYDRRIDETIRWFQDRREALLVKSIDRDTRTGEINIFKMTKELNTFSNAPAIKNALVYCLAAIRELERMRLAPTLDAERIEALKRGIPDIGEMIESKSEKPLPRINVDPRSLLPSDSQMAWEIGKLNEKFKKLMRK